MKPVTPAEREARNKLLKELHIRIERDRLKRELIERGGQP